MSKLDDLITQYYDETGEIPDERTIRDFMDQMEYDSGYRQQRFHQDYSHRPTTIDRASSDLLSEVGGIFTSIARSAGTAVRNKGSIITKNKQLNEFSFMLAIFLCKAGLYFLLQNSYNKGYDFSNL